MSTATAAACAMPRINPRYRAMGLALGDCRCTRCAGRGVRDYGERLCGCVQRRIWRACVWRADIVEACAWPRIKRSSGTQWTLPAQEFAADVWITARRALDGKPNLLRVLELRCRGGHEWRTGIRIVKCTQAEWFRWLYRAEELAGQACLDTRPHALYPIDEYFAQ